MKIVQINTFPYKATGAIMMNLHELMKRKGMISYVIWGRGRKPQDEYEISLSDGLGVLYHGLYSRLFDKTGFASTRATRKLIARLRGLH